MTSGNSSTTKLFPAQNYEPIFRELEGTRMSNPTTPGVCWWLAMDICFGTDRCIPGLDCEAYHPAADREPTLSNSPTTDRLNEAQKEILRICLPDAKSEKRTMASDSTTIPEEILEAMASAMLEPDLGIEASRPGNIIRKQVLRRALTAASNLGWRLEKNDVR